MNIKEMCDEINRLGISKELYSVLQGGIPNEKLCLVYDGDWVIYYSERGHKTGEKKFESECEACEVFLHKLKRYARIDLLD